MSEVLIIDVESLPGNPANDVWYHYNYNYYYWTGSAYSTDRGDGQPSGGGTAENPAPPPTQRPNDR